MPTGTTDPGQKPKLRLDKTSDGGITLVKLSGTIDEQFEGKKIASGIKGGTLILELAEIERISSFGIREWVDFIVAVSAKVSSLWFVECAPKVVDVVRVPAVDQDIALAEERHQLFDHPIHDRRRHHEPYGARGGEFLRQLLERGGAGRAFPFQGLHRIRVHIVGHAFVTVPGEVGRAREVHGRLGDRQPEHVWAVPGEDLDQLVGHRPPDQGAPLPGRVLEAICTGRGDLVSGSHAGQSGAAAIRLLEAEPVFTGEARRTQNAERIKLALEAARDAERDRFTGAARSLESLVDPGAEIQPARTDAVQRSQALQTDDAHDLTVSPAKVSPVAYT